MTTRPKRSKEQDPFPYPQGYFPTPTDFLNFPVRTLRTSKDAALMYGVARDGTRYKHDRLHSAIQPIQHYIMRNNHSLYDRGESTIYAPPPYDYTASDYFDKCTPLFEAKIVRDGSILGYIIQELPTGRPLLKVHFHGDTKSPFSRAFKAFVRSPILKWDVENWGLYEDMPNGWGIGKIVEVFPDNRVFYPEGVVGMPRLEMQYASSLGAKYLLAVTDIPEPVGEVQSNILARFVPRSETYDVRLRNMTREEAVLWFTMVIATDMKRRKSQNARYF